MGTSERSTMSRGAATAITASLKMGEEEEVNAPFSSRMCDPSRFPGLVTTRNVSTMSGILLLFQYMFLAFSIASGASRALWGVHPPRDWAGVDFTRKRVKIN